MKMNRIGKVEQADGRSGGGRQSRAGGYHKLLKRLKARMERRRAAQDPECLPAYNRYRGYET
jgi:hypothetical protein